MPEDIRWKQRLTNLETAVIQLREPIDRDVASLSDLEKQGTVQRFEIALELAWKAMKDYLQSEGVALDPITPRNVVKEAFTAGIVADGQVWIDMLNHRNALSHTYSVRSFNTAVAAIRDRYLESLESLVSWLQDRE